MKILIGCESSGTVRDAFIARGHDAMSCDLLPTVSPGPHFEGDVFEAIKMQQWDMAIFHPPCTYLTVSANKWLKDQPPRKSGVLVGAERRAAMEEAIGFFLALWNCGIPKIAIENPIGIMSTRLRKPDQVLQPWMFGHDESKGTCLWLMGLPLLVETKNVRRPDGRYGNMTPSGQNKLGPSPDRWKLRSITYVGLAAAMAEQWG